MPAEITWNEVAQKYEAWGVQTKTVRTYLGCYDWHSLAQRACDEWDAEQSIPDPGTCEMCGGNTADEWTKRCDDCADAIREARETKERGQCRE